MNAKFSLYVTAIALFAILTLGVGCTKAPNDAQLTSDIQNSRYKLLQRRRAVTWCTAWIK